MLSTFGTLNTALRTLQTMQASIQTTSNNVSNAATPGYSRQKVTLTAGLPYTLPAMNMYAPVGQLGTGVVATGVERFRASFLDSQLRNETTRAKGWETRYDALQQIEVSLNEPSDTGLNAHINNFWTAWKDLATTPNSVSARTALVETANDLTTIMRDTYRQLNDYQLELDDRVSQQVTQINDLASRIADLNKTIRDVKSFNQQPNDLMDERDKLITELSGLVNLDAFESETGTMMISVGGKLLVMDHIASPMAAIPDPTNNMMNQVIWADTGAVVQIQGESLAGGLTASAKDRLGGELGGTLIARDLMLGNLKTQLDDIANTFITEVNALHVTGYGLDNFNGRPFFDPLKTGAANIDVSSVIQADSTLVGTAAAADSPGDGSVALAISRLESVTLLNGGTTTINNYYRSMITTLGQEAEQAGVMADNQELLVDHLNTQQEAIAGVSLDEETVNLLQYQRTYQAAARVMTTVDEMLDKIINGMGLVGR